MTRLILIILFSKALNIAAQTYVIDGSFEDTLYCPQSTDLSMAQWYKPTYASSDSYCSCRPPDSVLGGAHQAKVAKEGDCFIGLGLHRPSAGSNDPREYVETKLIEELDSGKSYCISLYTVLSTTSNYAISNIHVGFRADSGYVNTGGIIAVDTFLKFTTTPILDSVNWTKLEIEYVASGFENYLTIGNFDSVGAMNVYDFNALTTPPYLQNYSYYFFDMITLEECVDPPPTPVEHFSLYPNPSNGNALYIDKYADTTANIYLYNSIGQQVGTKELPTGAYQGAVFEHIAAGVYILIYETAVGYYEERKVVVIR